MFFVVCVCVLHPIRFGFRPKLRYIPKCNDNSSFKGEMVLKWGTLTLS